MTVEAILDPKIGGGAEGLERSLQQVVGFLNGYGANDPESDAHATPVYNGVGFIFDGNRDTVDGGTLRLRSVGVNHLTLTNTGATSDLAWTFDTLTVTTLTVLGNLAVQGNTTLGNQNSDTTTVQGALAQAGGTWALSSPTTGGLVTSGNRTDGVGGVYSLTVTGAAQFAAASWELDGPVTIDGVTTVRNAAGSAIHLLVDPTNSRAIFGNNGVALTSDVQPNVSVVGRLYVAPASANDSAIQMRRSAAATVGWTVGVESTIDLVFKDDSDTSIVRIGDAASTYQLDVLAGDFHVADDAVIAGDISAGRGVFGGTTFSGGEELRVVGQTRLEGATEVTTGGLTVTAGGLTVTAGGATITAGGLTVSADGATITGGIVLASSGNIDGNGGTAGQLRIGAVIVNAASLDGTEELLVNGQTRLKGTTTVTTGGLAVSAGGISTDCNGTFYLITGTNVLTAAAAVGGAATALPALPVEYFYVHINGNARRVPAYA